MAAHLVFGRPRHAGGSVNLVFGGSGPVVLPDPVSVTIAFQLPDVQVQALLLYDNKNPRRASTSATMPHQVADSARFEPVAAHGQAKREERHGGGAWKIANAAEATPGAAWQQSSRVTNTPAAAWRAAQQIAQAWALAHERAAVVAQELAAPWGIGASASAAWALAHERAAAHRLSAAVLWQVGEHRHATHTGVHGGGLHRSASLLAPWQQAGVLPPGREVWPPATPSQPTPRVPSTHLVFACPPWLGGPVHLVFGRVCGLPTGPLAPVYILPARFYMAVHTLTAHRLPDLAPVPIFDVSLSADVGSFGWTFSASAPSSVFDQLAPTAGLPAQIRITLDGMPFVFVVDSLQRDERFGQRGARISGRSATALLARPYARETARLSTAAATAQQLALDALEFTGVGLDWGLTDWLVPTGAWSHTGTPLAAVQAIVEAAGGYLQSHRSAATLLARHPYPELAGGLPGGPWNWYALGVVPDVELAPDAIITSGIERRDGADINGVYVSGVSQGVLRLVKRTGTAADKLAGLITDPLITAQEVALQRGLSTLGAAGPKHLVQIELPVLTGASQPGVLDVGQLVQVNASSAWRGRVRSVSVNAKMPKARQTVQIERHLETV